MSGGATPGEAFQEVAGTGVKREVAVADLGADLGADLRIVEAGEKVTVRKEPVAEVAPAVPETLVAGGAQALVLHAETVSRELVVLRGGEGQLPAAYGEIAAGVLRKSWRRTSLFFSSVREGDGSTEAAVNLAALIGRQGLPVLLVELLFTEPVLWGLLGKPLLHCGFEDALRGTSEYEECAQPVAGECLNLLLLRDAMAAEEAGQMSGALNDFLEWAEERFAWLIFVCPPVLTPGWTRWLDLNADPVVLVARRGETRQHELRKVVRHLGDRLAGTLLSSAAR